MPSDLKAQVKQIIRGLAKAYPDATCALMHESAYQLLVATILSAQCTDERVNMVTPRALCEISRGRIAGPGQSGRR